MCTTHSKSSRIIGRLNKSSRVAGLFRSLDNLRVSSPDRVRRAVSLVSQCNGPTMSVSGYLVLPHADTPDRRQLSGS